MTFTHKKEKKRTKNNTFPTMNIYKTIKKLRKL